MTPRAENDCRDLLATRLGDLLGRLDVAVDREVQVAREKRPDLQLRAPQGGKLPVEAKRQQHSALWTAPSDQLDALYCRDPETEGLGTYLVFWFSARQGLRPHPDTGVRPNSAEQLREALEARLTEEQRPRLAIVVLDVSEPDGAANRGR